MDLTMIFTAVVNLVASRTHTQSDAVTGVLFNLTVEATPFFLHILEKNQTRYCKLGVYNTNINSTVL